MPYLIRGGGLFPQRQFEQVSLNLTWLCGSDCVKWLLSNVCSDNETMVWGNAELSKVAARYIASQFTVSSITSVIAVQLFMDLLLTWLCYTQIEYSISPRKQPPLPVHSLPHLDYPTGDTRGRWFGGLRSDCKAEEWENCGVGLHQSGGRMQRRKKGSVQYLRGSVSHQYLIDGPQTSQSSHWSNITLDISSEAFLRARRIRLFEAPRSSEHIESHINVWAQEGNSAEGLMSSKLVCIYIIWEGSSCELRRDEEIFHR